MLLNKTRIDGFCKEDIKFVISLMTSGVKLSEKRISSSKIKMYS